MTLNSRRRRDGPRKKALEEGRVTVAIVVSGRKEEGERMRRKERGRRPVEREGEREREERRPTRDKTRRADDGYDGDGQWLYTG